ncbi:Alanine--tRNA ligase [Mycoplasmopsis californica]|uniref:Alanine--tRNA ligase n=1 Tax=Mycoplasmopsis equigenitalium TaxID=114883 RepID=A0ABY5J1Z2_9BACT|nr:alanine--tRNA ligase [Mycoplasmopsis equigenitalium]UUD37274.1 alanine--tRNA ligase [Mycoplasmopsis equigenitalium]VEU69417.1 Alanine--tRNA ligase [Mycoplasmopsis californica]
MLNSKQIRTMWLEFFKSKDHLIVEPKSLIPIKDNSLLWINSGVATLKDYFSGKKKPPHPRLTNSQKAIRTNDIENVGVTTRHHTFFEMLGNFSIGDYFKKEAIAWGAEFVIKHLKLSPEKIYVTYFKEDLETRDLWIKHGIDPIHMVPGDKKTNFWEHGLGPCGPNTEIFYDRGEKFDKRGVELIAHDIDNDRFIEIWNIVFSTFNHLGDGKYTELKQKNIDTGAGLERIVSIMQDAPTNYDTDLFIPIIKEIEKLTPYKYDINNYFTKEKEQAQINTSFKIIADHMRTVANAIGDGASVSNIGRGYIIRRLIRRSYYQSFILKIKDKTFLYKLIKTIKETLPFEYDVKKVESVVKNEELLFAKTIEKGRKLLLDLIAAKKVINEKTVFQLYETYGFPFELTIEILKEYNIEVDAKKLENEKAIHADKSRNKQVSGMTKAINSLALVSRKISEFTGYETMEGKAKILFMADAEKEISSSKDKCYLILDRTPFYATSGGQNHDNGYMLQADNKIQILDVFKDKNNNHVHFVKGVVKKDLPLECFVDKERRYGMMRNHSSTHIVFSIMRQVLGNHIVQLGSDITDERFTFDFPSERKLTKAEIDKIEEKFKEFIEKDIKRDYHVITLNEAKKQNVYMTLEEMEYMNPNAVRMVDFKEITKDLCGGTHVPNTGFIEAFKIVSVEKKQAGVYRLRAITTNKLVDKYYKDSLQNVNQELDVLKEKITKFDSKFKFKNFNNKDQKQQLLALENYLEELKNELVKLSKLEAKKHENLELEFKTKNIGGKEVVYSFEVPAQVLNVQAATQREKHKNSIVILGSKQESGMILCVGSHLVDSNKLLQKIFAKTNGKGGGNAIFAIGKLSDDSNLLKVIESAVKDA